MTDTASTPMKYRRLRRAEAAKYLQDLGVPLTEKTLANRNAAGLDPKPDYLGTIPYYRTDRLEDFAETVFTPESPVTVTRRKARVASAAEDASVCK